MEPQITEKLDWLEIDGDRGILFVDCGSQAIDPTRGIKAAEEFYPGFFTVDHRVGHGCRLSMPGYLDCTEWTVFDTARECAEHLLAMWFDYPSDEMTPEQEEQRIELEAIAD